MSLRQVSTILYPSKGLTVTSTSAPLNTQSKPREVKRYKNTHSDEVAEPRLPTTRSLNSGIRSTDRTPLRAGCSNRWLGDCVELSALHVVFSLVTPNKTR